VLFRSIAGILLDERAATGHVALGRFYVRRLLRLWPALLAVLLIDYLTGEPRRGLVWLNALYVNNFVPVWFVALGWTWSLAIEEQFYLVCPWILYAVHRLTTRGRVAALLFLMLALVGVAAIVVTTHDLRPWDAEIVGQLDPLRWGMAFDVFYDKPWMRAGPLLAGVTAAVLFRSAAVMDALARRRIPTGVALVLAILLMAASTHWPLAVGSSRVVEVLYLSTFRAVFGVCAAFIMLVTVSQHPFGRALAKPLSARWLFPVSQLAYPAYLLNPLVTLYVDAWLGPAVSLSEDPMRVLIPCDAIATFACAAILHVTVERPGMELRPRAASSMGEATGPLTQPG